MQSEKTRFRFTTLDNLSKKNRMKWKRQQMKGRTDCVVEIFPPFYLSENRIRDRFFDLKAFYKVHFHEYTSKDKKEMCLSFRDYREWELNLRKREMSEPDPSTDCFIGSKTQDLRRIYSSDNVFYLFPTLYCNPIRCVTRFSKGKCFIVAGSLNKTCWSLNFRGCSASSGKWMHGCC